MIGYYIHHHGTGHRARAESISAWLRSPVTALSSMPITSLAFDDTVQLPRDDRAKAPVDPTAGGSMHWVPRRDRGLCDRMAAISHWIATNRPAALVVDVSVEVAVFARLLGVPVITVVLPGTRTDAAHSLGFRIADHLIAAWPKSLYNPPWLRPFQGKTSYVGGISRFEHRTTPLREPSDRIRVLVMGGGGGGSITLDQIDVCRRTYPQYEWRAIGFDSHTWVEDPWATLCHADVVVSHAGQGALADIATADRPALILPQSRPFDEQIANARTVGRAGLALTSAAWPSIDAWPALIDRAQALRAGRWTQWQTTGAAQRAATSIEQIAYRQPAR